MSDALKVYIRLNWTRLSRRRFGWFCLALLLLPLIVTAALSASGHFGRGLYDNLLEVHFGFLLPAIPTMLLANAMGEEIESQTHTFLFARPAPRGALLIGKGISVLLPMAAALCVLLPAEYLVALARFPEDLGPNAMHMLRATGAAVLGTFCYGALALAIGTRFAKHPFMAVLGYLVVVEGGFGSAPAALHLIAMQFHLSNLAGLPLPESFFVVATVPAWGSAIAISAFTALLMLIAVQTIEHAEYT